MEVSSVFVCHRDNLSAIFLIQLKKIPQACWRWNQMLIPLLRMKPVKPTSHWQSRSGLMRTNLLSWSVWLHLLLFKQLCDHREKEENAFILTSLVRSMNFTSKRSAWWILSQSCRSTAAFCYSNIVTLGVSLHLRLCREEGVYWLSGVKSGLSKSN